VEFLVDREMRYYFLEMNTRLQVEHPVTEMVTGIDIVEQQIRVAAGRPLELVQRDVPFLGHAIEFRINAEDPDQGFKPDPGTIKGFEEPVVTASGIRARWDSAVAPGWKIPPHYDSLIGKLIVHGPDRPAALAGAREALRSMRIEGVRTTIPLHLRILDHAEFQSGRYDIDFVTRSGVLRGA
jgi:acetyl-CoA carboxylase biotin carboxylase subunit